MNEKKTEKFIIKVMFGGHTWAKTTFLNWQL